MATVRITDPDTFNHAVEVLVRLGGTFETWGVGVLVMTPDQKAVLEKAGIVSETEEKSPTNGKKRRVLDLSILLKYAAYIKQDEILVERAHVELLPALRLPKVPSL